MDGPYSDASPTFTQMSLFPTVEEQIEQIAQSQAEASTPAFSVGMVPEQAVERILPEPTSLLGRSVFMPSTRLALLREKWRYPYAKSLAPAGVALL